LFKPDILHDLNNDVGLHKTVYKALDACSYDVRNEMYNNIILSGGTSMIKGIDTRLQKELEALAP